MFEKYYYRFFFGQCHGVDINNKEINIWNEQSDILVVADNRNLVWWLIRLKESHKKMDHPDDTIWAVILILVACNFQNQPIGIMKITCTERNKLVKKTNLCW